MRPSNVVNISEDWDLRRREGKVISPSLAFFLTEKKKQHSFVTIAEGK